MAGRWAREGSWVSLSELERVAAAGGPREPMVREVGFSLLPGFYDNVPRLFTSCLAWTGGKNEQQILLGFFFSLSSRYV